MNIRNLSDTQLISETKRLVAEERRVSLEVLRHLKEIDRRRLYAQFKCSSLHEYCTRELKYSEGSAQRRIESARLLALCPEIDTQIESGSLNLSLLSKAQVFFRREEIRDTEEKREILKSIANQSCRTADRSLMSRSSEPAKHIPEKIKQVSETYSEIRFAADQEFVAQIEELKNLLGEPSLKEVLAYALKTALEKKRPKAPKSALPPTSEVQPAVRAAAVEPKPPTSEATSPLPASAVQSQPPASEAPSRYIPVETRRQIWARDNGQCTYRDPETSQRCPSRFGLELDHLKPHALGGSNDAANLTLKCHAHNQYAAIRAFGHAKMARHVPGLC